MKSKRSIVLLTIFVVLLVVLTGCKLPGVPSATKGIINGRVLMPPTAKELSKDITGWVPAANAVVTIVDANGKTHTTTTDANGNYSFENISVKANTVVTAKVQVNGKTIILKDIIPNTVGADGKYNAGTMDPESTALALVVEELQDLGLPVDLVEIKASDDFQALVGQVQEVLDSHGNVETDADISDAVADVASPGEGGEPTPPGGGGTPTISVSAISVDPVEMYLELGKTAKITATVSPSNATNKRVTWSSGSEEVATVDDSGLVTAVATGTATITATTVDKGFTATCKVTVAWDGEMAVEPEMEDNAYIINHSGEFAWFMGRNVTGETIVLNNDIDLSGEEWTPLANSNDFVIDGNGHTIRNFTLAMGGQDGLGMFGRKGIEGATIKDLVIEDVSFTGTPGNLYYAGVLVGDFHNGTLENIIVRNVSVSAQKWAGAVAGQVMNSDLKNITVENSSVELTDGQSKAGGVTGSWRFESGKDAGTAENLVVRDSTITAPKQAGGIIGNIDSRVAGIQMIDCISENNTIKSVAEDLAGCLVADVYHGGSDYPEDVILTINNPAVSGNTINEISSDRLVGGDGGHWELKSE